ncbi:hypothetical protein EYF80_046722 [Liparis tanakae]|uniref:Uncharacterized protein n=1 Tax=Liparis tanakae TaxID=230148 RepID=A0A4Z2FPL1_9TELE|nr:hypothetical protein EYF80_046722 [Liparis tanakae]
MLAIGSDHMESHIVGGKEEIENCDVQDKRHARPLMTSDAAHNDASMNPPVSQQPSSFYCLQFYKIKISEPPCGRNRSYEQEELTPDEEEERHGDTAHPGATEEVVTTISPKVRGREEEEGRKMRGDGHGCECPWLSAPSRWAGVGKG